MSEQRRPITAELFTIRPEVVEAARQANLAIGRAFMACGIELAREFAQLLDQSQRGDRRG